MADWRDGFREGSFRGVGFKTESHQLKGGRRKQDREFAKRDTGNSEDLGKRLRKFNLELLVLGDDYFAQRDALVEALETKGPGELIHPYLGTFRVQAGNFTLIETVGEQRLARFTVEFSLAGALKFPNQVEDDLNEALNDAASVKDSSKSVFETIFSVANQPAFVLESATARITEVLDFADNAVNKVTEPVTNFTFAIRNFKAAIGDLIKKPGELAQRLQDTFDLLLNEFEDDPDTTEKIFGNFRDISFDPVIGTTPSRNKERDNQNALLNLTIELTLSNQAISAINKDFDSVDGALISRNDVVERFAIQLIDITDNDLFQSIKDLQTSLTKALPRTGETELITFTPIKTLPALVIAYDLFEDLTKEDEIVDQNGVDHPGFVPGGDPIKVSAG